MFFVSIPKFVDTELQKRRDNRLQFQRPKSTWLRMTSGYIGDDGRKTLQGGVSEAGGGLSVGFQQMYENTSTGEVRRPQPTIESINTKERFENVEATVNWKVFSQQQLFDLFPFFMNLGSSVFLDYGWSDASPQVNVASDVELQELWKSFTTGEDTSMQVELADSTIAPGFKGPYHHPKFGVLKRGGGRYGFLKGIIVDFSYDPEGEGIYSCTTTIQSASKAMAATRTYGQTNRRTFEENPKKALDEFMEQDYVDRLQQAVNGTTSESSNSVASFKNPKTRTERASFGLIGGRDDVARTDVGSNDYVYYLTWGVIEQALLPKLKRESGAGAAIAEYDSAGSLISNFKAGSEYLRSTDPYVCIVNNTGSNEPFIGFTDTPPPDWEVNGIDYRTEGFEMKENKRGWLYNLYVHYELVYEAFVQHQTVNEALMFMLELCSEACFDVWDFDIVDETNAYKVIDKNAVENPPRPKEGKSFEFRLDTIDTIARNYSFNTNLDDIIKNQLVAQKYNTDSDAAVNDRNDSTTLLFRKFTGEDVILSNQNREGEEGERASSQAPPQNNDASNDPEEEEKPEGPVGSSEQIEALAKVIGDGTNGGMLFTGTEEEGDNAAAKLSAKLQADADPYSPANGGNIVNIDVEIELDGISGFCTYQVLNIEGVPQVLTENGVFFVEEVSQNVTAQDWTTTLKCQLATKNLVS